MMIHPIDKHIHDDIPYIVKNKDINELIIAIPKLDKDVFEDLKRSCQNLDIEYRRMSDILPK